MTKFCMKLPYNILAIHIVNFGGIPYTAHGAQITPSPLIFDFCLIFCFYAYLRLGIG